MPTKISANICVDLKIEKNQFSQIKYGRFTETKNMNIKYTCTGTYTNISYLFPILIPHYMAFVTEQKYVTLNEYITICHNQQLFKQNKIKRPSTTNKGFTCNMIGSGTPDLFG